MHAVVARALRLEYDDREEPIVEIDAPAGYGATAERIAPQQLAGLREDAARFEHVAEGSDSTTESIRRVNAANKQLHGRTFETSSDD